MLKFNSKDSAILDQHRKKILTTFSKQNNKKEMRIKIILYEMKTNSSRKCVCRYIKDEIFFAFDYKSHRTFFWVVFAPNIYH